MTLSNSLQSFGAGAAAATHSVVNGGMQTLAHGASTAVQTLPQAMPQAVSAGAAGTAQLATDLAVVEKPARAIANTAPKLPFLVRTASFLSKALPVVAITASGLSGAKIVNDKGAGALLTTKDGRGAVLGAVGGVLLLMPHPATQLAAAGVLGATAVNHFGGMDRLDDVTMKPRS